MQMAVGINVSLFYAEMLFLNSKKLELFDNLWQARPQTLIARLLFTLLWIPLRETPHHGRLDDILAVMHPGNNNNNNMLILDVSIANQCDRMME